jgi:hypothetical protein
MSSPGNDPRDPSAVRLGRQLKRLRTAAGYPTQSSFAPRLSWGEDVIQKTEVGKRVPSDEVFPAWLHACRLHRDGTRPVLTDGEEQALTELWEAARADNGAVREFFAEYLKAEVNAVFLRLWGLLLIPGPLQTEGYAHSMFLLGGLDEDEATEQTALRMQRRLKVDGPNPARVTALIHERALYFQVGSPETMVAQLTDLLELSKRRNVVLQVVPDKGYFPGAVGQFDIASGPKIADIVDMITVEDHVTADSDVVGKAAAVFEEIRGYALNVVDSQALLTKAIGRWNSQQQ